MKVKNKDNLIMRLTKEFALRTIAYTDELIANKKFVIGKQLMRSETSIGANVREAQNAESRADFIHKMKIAAKEASETQYWLELCEESPGYPELNTLDDDIDHICRVLSKILASSRGNK